MRRLIDEPIRLMRREIGRIMIAASEKNNRHDRMRLTAIARERCGHPFEAARSLPIEESLREKKMLFLEMPIGEVTLLLAEHFSLKERGRIEEGLLVGILVFDFDLIESRVTSEATTRSLIPTDGLWSEPGWYDFSIETLLFPDSCVILSDRSAWPVYPRTLPDE